MTHRLSVARSGRSVRLDDMQNVHERDESVADEFPLIAFVDRVASTGCKDETVARILYIADQVLPRLPELRGKAPFNYLSRADLNSLTGYDARADRPCAGRAE